MTPTNPPPTTSDDRAAPEQHPTLGRLEVICGPMFAGKSTELIRRLVEAAEAGQEVLGVKPALDDRYHPTAIATHTDLTFDGVTVRHAHELTELEADVLGLDEAHFFSQGLRDALSQLLNRGTRIIIAGLDRTSFNEPFHEMGTLLVEADEVTKLEGVCSICGRRAVHTVRLIEADEDIIVGGADWFANRCRAHLRTAPVYLGKSAQP